MVVRSRLSLSQTVERIAFLMISKKKMKVVYGVMIYLLAVGVLCYAAFPVSPPEEPMRIMFKVTAGKVLFDHYTHTSESAYGLSCWDCHHHPMDDDAALIACGECHTVPEEPAEYPSICSDCHEEDEIEGTQIMKRSDAFHAGCVECHEAFDAGPVTCETCHAMQ